MRIGFATADWAVASRDAEGRPTYGGSGWARIGLPARHLRAAGLDVFEGTLAFSRDTGQFLIRRWPVEGESEAAEDLCSPVDLVVMQRWMFASIVPEIAEARRHGQIIVNDLDDHFWALDPRNQAAKASDPALNSLENRDHYLDVLRASSAVTVSTVFLGDELRRLRIKCPIYVLPNHVDLDVFADVRQANLQRLQNDPVAPLAVGWVGGTPWRSGDLETLRGILSPWLERVDALAYHGGHLADAPPFHVLAGIDPKRLWTRPMVPIADYSTLFRDLDVGLVPLRDIPFNRAKSWIKGIEYAAAGVPFIATDLPEYRALEARYGVGTVASRPKDWMSFWSRMRSPAARLEVAEENLAGVKALDIHQGIRQWLDLYLALLVA